MRTFTFTRAGSVAEAVDSVRSPEHRFVAGGTTLIDLMKLDVELPDALIDINSLPLAGIARTDDGGLRIGALARNSEVANHADVQRDYPMLSQALLSGASAQLRNMASTAGNLLQRTRCVYFRDTAAACNKRDPGSGCAAIGGYNRNLAILGVSDWCIASNPSEATIEIEGNAGKRRVAVGDFFRLPGDTPQHETELAPGELITAVVLPPPAKASRSLYLKLRDRASYEFALASAAVIVSVANGAFSHVRIAMGGIGTVPWRCSEAESLLMGERPAREAFQTAARAVLRDAKPQSENGFKVELARRCLVHALTTVTAGA
jgi:xanthine dehydrogenase YagS FAD-binding subunit